MKLSSLMNKKNGKVNLAFHALKICLLGMLSLFITCCGSSSNSLSTTKLINEKEDDMDINNLQTLGQLYKEHKNNAPDLLISSFETLGEWTETGDCGTMSISPDAVHKSSSLSLANAGWNNCILSKSGSWNFSKHHFSIAVKFAEKADRVWFNMWKICFYSGQEGGCGDLKQYYPLGEGSKIDQTNGEWAWIVFSRANVSNNRNINWSKITKIEIQLQVQSGYYVDVYFDELLAIKTFPYPLIGFRFDDNGGGIYTIAKPKMDEYGYRGIAAVPTAMIGVGGHMKDFQLREMNAAGWDISSHSHNHIDFGDQSIAPEIKWDELRTSQNVLMSLGIEKGSRFLVYPFGGYLHVDYITRDYMRMLYVAGFSYLDYGVGAWNDKTEWFQGCSKQWNCVPPCNLQQEIDEIIEMKSAIDDLITYNGILWLGFHNVLPDDPYSIRETAFREIVDYVHSSGAIVITYSDFYDNFL